MSRNDELSVKTAHRDQIATMIEMTAVFSIHRDAQAGVVAIVPTAGQLSRLVDAGEVRVVSDSSGRLLGFCSAYTGTSESFLRNQTETMKQIAWDESFVLPAPDQVVILDRMIVSLEGQRRRAATELYRDFRLRYSHLDALVAVLEKPRLNQRSQRLLDWLGFRRVGCVRADHVPGMAEFQAGILHRPAR